ncbi:MAG: hypothetical protein VW891_15515, partial [Novosphingobium sp.]
MYAYIVGVGTTPFGKAPESDHRALAGEALSDVLSDAGLDDG